jgi:hypothetical protein
METPWCRNGRYEMPIDGRYCKKVELRRVRDQRLLFVFTGMKVEQVYISSELQ